MPAQGTRRVRYDAAIIGAGANGLAAAALLGRAGRSVIVLDRAQTCGGRCTTREFHPGFRASPFCDEVAPIPVKVFRALDLARHGAIFARVPQQRFSAAIAALRAQAIAEAAQAQEHGWFGRRQSRPWPLQDWLHRSLKEACADLGYGAMAGALEGRAADPAFDGSALHLLSPGSGGSGILMGGLGTLGRALEAAARAAGADFALGMEATDLRHRKRRAEGVRLADGTEIEARAVISTLDLRRTFFSLFAWKDLPPQTIERVAQYRHAAARARLLIALDGPTPFGAPVYLGDRTAGYAAWRSAAIAEMPPMTLRPVSAADPGLAPDGKAVVTATLGCVPYRLFDGPWTNEKRAALKERVLAALDLEAPGIRSKALAAELIVPPDIEAALGLSEGDLDGGEIAPDQMFALRGFENCPGGRTPVRGLYLGGSSAPLGPIATCAAGAAAAAALAADLEAGLLK